MFKTVQHLLSATVLGAAMVAAVPAFAQTVPAGSEPTTGGAATTSGAPTTTLNVTATVPGSCSISSSPVAFGSVDVTDGRDHDATGSISVLCTQGTNWTAAADQGSGATATVAAREMRSGTDTLYYSLYTDSSMTQAWGDGSLSTTLLNGRGTGSTENIVIAGRVSGGQTAVPAGDYADTVNGTLTY